MKHMFLTLTIVFAAIAASSQQKKYLAFAFFNTQSAMPFGKLTGKFREAFHPGIEFSYGKNFSTKKKHDWFLEYKLGYFFHRYVQHGIPLYTNLGYRYHFGKHFSVETSIGAGVMKSIPATEVFNQGMDGLYHKEKGKGREQLIATYGIGLRYKLNPASQKPLSIITNYQQRIQFPFVRSYIPILPYNSFMIGVSLPIGKSRLNGFKESFKPRPVDRLFIQKRKEQ